VAQRERAAALGKGEAEMQEQGRRQQARNHIADVDRRVEGVQLAGVVERVEDEARQAQQVEVQRLRSAVAAEEHEQPDDQVGRADQVLPVERAVAVGVGHDHFGGDFDPAALQRVDGLAPDAGPEQQLHHVDGLAHGDRGRVLDGGDPQQDIAAADAGAVGGPAGLHINSHHPRSAPRLRRIHPGGAVFRQVKTHLLLVVDAGADHRRQGQHHQQCAKELAFQSLLHLRLLRRSGDTDTSPLFGEAIQVPHGKTACYFKPTPEINGLPAGNCTPARVGFRIWNPGLPE